MHCYFIERGYCDEMIDCWGKYFYCLNSTQFISCFVYSSNSSETMGNASHVNECPANTWCNNNESFECAIYDLNDVTQLKNATEIPLTTKSCLHSTTQKPVKVTKNRATKTRDVGSNGKPAGISVFFGPKNITSCHNFLKVFRLFAIGISC